MSIVSAVQLLQAIHAPRKRQARVTQQDERTRGVTETRDVLI